MVIGERSFTARTAQALTAVTTKNIGGGPSTIEEENCLLVIFLNPLD